MTALPSRYNGVVFRSRLEARVAVFLDAIGARWEYEYEGFNLDGRNYLPDFWLPETHRRGVPERDWDTAEIHAEKGVWLEVKPNHDDLDEYTQLLQRLAEHTKHTAYLFVGNIRLLDWFNPDWTEDDVNLTEISWNPWDKEREKELWDDIQELHGRREQVERSSVMVGGDPEVTCQMDSFLEQIRIFDEVVRDETKQKNSGGSVGWDNCMAFQSDGGNTTIQFHEGSNEWGNPEITARAVEEALSYRFA